MTENLNEFAMELSNMQDSIVDLRSRLLRISERYPDNYRSIKHLEGYCTTGISAIHASIEHVKNKEPDSTNKLKSIMHENAYGLSIEERNEIIKMAKSNCYYDAYIAERYNISIIAVRDICKRAGDYVCQRIVHGRHIDGYEIK